MRKYVSVRMGVVRPVVVAMGMRVSHGAMLYYNVTGRRQCHPGGARQGFPIAMAMAAARNGKGTETAARNQTKRAGMNGISHNRRR